MPWTGIEPARPGVKVRIGSQQPPRRCAPYGTRTRDLPLDRRASTPSWTDRAWRKVEESNLMAATTTRVATGRRATPASPSIRGGSEDRTRTPVWAFRFRDGCRRRPSAGPSSHHVVRRAGLEPARPQGDLVYSQAGQPIAQPTHVPQRWHPRRLRRGSLRRQEAAPAARVRLLPDAVHCRVRPHSPSLGSESGEVSPRPCDR